MLYYNFTKYSVIKMFKIFSKHICTHTCDLMSGKTNPEKQKQLWKLASIKCVQVLVYSWWEVVFNVLFHPETLKNLYAFIRKRHSMCLSWEKSTQQLKSGNTSFPIRAIQPNTSVLFSRTCSTALPRIRLGYS